MAESAPENVAVDGWPTESDRPSQSSCGGATPINNCGKREGVKRMRTVVMILAFAALAACASGPGESRGDAITEAGHRVAQLKCARCHAIDATGESPNSNAPAFREVSQSVAIEATEATLADGIRIGHQDMPPVRLSRTEIEEIRAYLESLRQ